jgi:hypothetical protein
VKTENLLAKTGSGQPHGELQKGAFFTAGTRPLMLEHVEKFPQL